MTRCILGLAERQLCLWQVRLLIILLQNQERKEERSDRKRK